MKTKVLTAILILGVALQATAMGHPHNLFAARKKINAKRAAACQMPRSASSTERVATFTKTTVSASATIWGLFTKKGAK